MKFDVIIPVAAKDVNFLPTVVCYVRKNIINVNRIIAITNHNNFNKLNRSINDSSFIVLDEDKIIEDLSFENVRKLLSIAGEKRLSQTGWYFQQFLKFAFAYSVYAEKYYLSWDADTLPINQIDFFCYNRPLFTRKIEYHAPYFETMNKIIGIGRQVNYSFIAEHMLFNTNVVKELTDCIMKSNVKGKTWFEKIINACDFSIGKANLFSEFETYGNYCIKYFPNMYDNRILNTFRGAGMIRGRHINEHIISRLAIDFHIVSFENQDAPFPYNIGWNFYRLRRKLSGILVSIQNWRID